MEAADMVVEEMTTLMEAEAAHLSDQMNIVLMYLAIIVYQQNISLQT